MQVVISLLSLHSWSDWMYENPSNRKNVFNNTLLQSWSGTHRSVVTVWTSCTTTSSTPSTNPVTTRWSSSYTSISRTPSCSEKRNTSTCSSTQRSERSPQVQPLQKHFILLLFCLGGKSLICLEGRLISRLFGKNTILFCSFNVSLILWCGFLSQGRHF